MKKFTPHVVALSILVLLGTAGAARSAGVDMREGEWEIVTETSMTMGAMSMPPMTSKVTHCLTREDPVPKSEKESDCKVLDQKIAGNKVSWRFVCKDSEGEGEITYSGTTYKGSFRMKTAEGGGSTKKKASRKSSSGDGEAMTMNMKLSGRYLGPCPKGQKSGPTGETAKQMAAAKQAAAQAEQAQAEQAAAGRKTEAFIKGVTVPQEERGACAQKGFAPTPECEGKAGKLNLNPGEFEVTIEQATRMGPNYSAVETKRSKVCLTEDNPVPRSVSDTGSAQVKRGKERVTWTEPAGAGGTAKGGLVYRGDTVEGAVTQTMELGSGYQSLIVKKVTARRTGDGKCLGGRSYTAGGRGYTAKGRAEAGEKEKKDVLKNPVKGIRNLFGF